MAGFFLNCYFKCKIIFSNESRNSCGNKNIKFRSKCPYMVPLSCILIENTLPKMFPSQQLGAWNTYFLTLCPQITICPFRRHQSVSRKFGGIEREHFSPCLIRISPWYLRVQGGDEQRDVQTMQKHPRLTVKKNDHASFERRSGERNESEEVEREKTEKNCVFLSLSTMFQHLPPTSIGGMQWPAEEDAHFIVILRKHECKG